MSNSEFIGQEGMTLSQNQRIYAAATSPNTPIEVRQAIAATYNRLASINSL